VSWLAIRCSTHPFKDFAKDTAQASKQAEDAKVNPLPKDTPENNKRSFCDLLREGFGNGKLMQDMSEHERFERAHNFKMHVFKRIAAKQSEEDPKSKEDPESVLPKSRSWDDLEESELTELKIILEDILNQGAKMTVGGSFQDREKEDSAAQ
jgi:hypothetical protein